MENPNQHPNCENNKCTRSNGEVRLLRHADGSHARLCEDCYWVEIRYRASCEGRGWGKAEYPTWESLKIYSQPT
jgi:hypothetical protein